MSSKTFEKIKTQRDTYVNLLKALLSTCKDYYKILDIYYDQLEMGNSFVHVSIIVATSSLTFLQSYYSNSDDDGGSLSNDSSIDDFLRVYTLSISSLTGLALSILRFCKIDQKRENAHDLKVRFLDLHNRIRYQLDILRPWKDDNYFDDPEKRYYEDEWEKVWFALENEYKTIIDIKKSLFVECEKIISGETMNLFRKKAYNDLKYKQKYDKKFDELKFEIRETKNEKKQKELISEKEWSKKKKDFLDQFKKKCKEESFNNEVNYEEGSTISPSVSEEVKP